MTAQPLPKKTRVALDAALAELDRAKTDWAQCSISDRLRLLRAVKDGVMSVAADWAETSAREKGLDPETPIAGEDWIIGPYATMEGLNAYIRTLRDMPGKGFFSRLTMRGLPNGQTAVQVMPTSARDKLLLPGVRAEVWMRPGETPDTIRAKAARLYETPETEREGAVALVLGAGNVSSITPLDVLYKLLVENQVVILKMNPVNDDLTPFFETAMKPLIDKGALRIVRGGADVGRYLCDHPLVEELHITGSDKTHDAIVWGMGEEGAKNRAAGTPKNTKRFSSELGCVSPTLVVPGPWSAADVAYQAESIASMKLHNSGHNCIACQTLVMPEGWDKGAALLDAVKSVLATSRRPAWYPGTEDRIAQYAAHLDTVEKVERGSNAPPVVLGTLGDDDHNHRAEVFGPALGIKELPAPDTETYLRAAIAYANDELWGTLGANILIHPTTLRQIGQRRFEDIIAELRYGTIAINGWCGFGFFIATAPWGAFPGHTPEDIQSGTGVVHNAFMLEETERTVVRMPWAPFPRGFFSRELSLMPRPPFFITNKNQRRIGKALTRFQHRPSLRDLPKLLREVMRG
ncbi:aldehyde dehydrogenase family protein [Shimia sp. FJ5]|uniref:aldehyde dehydrogenase family protein n=1 Tax=Shimia sp. FJ5 TaxID=3079054 RepID=UPI00262691FF|nr:aldehyde dehydrogenase family protein [Shimia sp. FJ5]MDV4143596.1 aldehyde dehydrogenase family protein [Shimia sp. FJ5]